MHSVLNKCYRPRAKHSFMETVPLKKEKPILNIAKKLTLLMFNFVGLDVSESQLEQGSLIMKFYIIFPRRRSKKFFHLHSWAANCGLYP
jgi:hypothetical protein